MDRVQKQESVQQLEGWLNEAASVVVVHYRGMTVEEVTSLRRKAHANQVGIKVAKNSLAKLAADKTQYKGIKDLLTGPTALVFSKDAIAPAKTVVEFAKKNEKVVILGGALGDKLLDEAGVKAIAALPSLNESRAKLLALINTPASRIAQVVSAPGAQIARVLNAKASKGE
ncbi:MAG: 50S ribosomal protein L10 [Proteobacteria bacterium]|nr:50S ribosomal protein L10 [Pseudomonadota bacterium]